MNTPECAGIPYRQVRNSSELTHHHWPCGTACRLEDTEPPSKIPLRMGRPAGCNAARSRIDSLSHCQRLMRYWCAEDLQTTQIERQSITIIVRCCEKGFHMCIYVYNIYIYNIYIYIYIFIHIYIYSKHLASLPTLSATLSAKTKFAKLYCDAEGVP